MRKSVILLLTLLLTIPNLHSQQLDIIWQQCLGTDDNDIPGCITKTNNGILVSTTIGKSAPGISNYHGGGDSWLVNIDTTGSIIWEKCFGGSNSDNIKKIIALPDNEYYLLGGTNSTDGDVQSNTPDSYSIWVVKIDSSHNIIWEKCYGNNDGTSPVDAVLTEDGGLLFTGTFHSGAGGDITVHYGNNDAWLCRINSLGDIIWEKTFGNHNSDRIWRILPTTNNTYMLIGSFYDSGGMIECQKDNSPYLKDLWLIEISTTGEIIRQFCYGGSYHDVGKDIIEVEGGYVMLGYTESDDMDVSGHHGGGYPGGPIPTDIWVVKIGYHGEINWQKCYGGTDYELPANIFATEDGGYVFFGDASSLNGDVVGNHDPYGESPDIWVVKIDSIGELQWQQCIGSHNMERISQHNVARMDDYNYAITIETFTLGGDVECLINPGGDNSQDAWVINIKDCSHYQPATPQKPIGKDYLCVNTDSITTYTTQIANGAWFYEWQLIPEVSGTITQDSLTTQIHWSPTYEGTATIKIRSSNDCGTSAWSDSLIIQTYICLGTEENNTNNHFLSVYPNPASSTLTVSYNKPVHKTPTTIEIFDIYGTVVTAQNMEAQKQKTVLDISRLAASLYFVRVIEDGILIGVKKVVVE